MKTVALDRSWPATCLAAPHTTPAWSGRCRRPAPISPPAHGRQTCPPPPCAQSEPARGRGHLWPLPTPQQERLGPPEQAPWKGPAAAPAEAGEAAAGRPDPAQVLGLPGEHVSAPAQAALSRARHMPRWGAHRGQARLWPAGRRLGVLPGPLRRRHRPFPCSSTPWGPCPSGWSQTRHTPSLPGVPHLGHSQAHTCQSACNL